MPLGALLLDTSYEDFINLVVALPSVVLVGLQLLLTLAYHKNPEKAYLVLFAVASLATALYALVLYEDGTPFLDGACVLCVTATVAMLVINLKRARTQ